VVDKGWIDAGALVVGDKLLAKDGSYLTVAKLGLVKKQVRVYNFEVAKLHTYFVGGQQQWLVHNTNTGECSITLTFEPGMNKPHFERKVAWLRELADQRLLQLRGPGESTRIRNTDPGLQLAYKHDVRARVERQFNRPEQRELRNRLITRLYRLQPDRVHELQLGGPHTFQNLCLTHGHTNVRIGNQIWTQLNGRYPVGTFITEINVVYP
jgi:hypothetical protein